MTDTDPFGRRGDESSGEMRWTVGSERRRPGWRRLFQIAGSDPEAAAWLIDDIDPGQGRALVATLKEAGIEAQLHGRVDHAPMAYPGRLFIEPESATRTHVGVCVRERDLARARQVMDDWQVSKPGHAPSDEELAQLSEQVYEEDTQGAPPATHLGH